MAPDLEIGNGACWRWCDQRDLRHPASAGRADNIAYPCMAVRRIATMGECSRRVTAISARPSQGAPAARDPITARTDDRQPQGSSNRLERSSYGMSALTDHRGAGGELRPHACCCSRSSHFLLSMG